MYEEQIDARITDTKQATEFNDPIKALGATMEHTASLQSEFLCYCKTTGSDLADSFNAAMTKFGELASDIKATDSDLTKTKAELQQAQDERTAGQKEMEAGTALRDKEAATFAKFKVGSDAIIYATETKLKKEIEAGTALRDKEAAIFAKFKVDSDAIIYATDSELV